ncbi:hypothetical protein DFP72DRAFT_1055142 [Ephemerocybe angulata]|uniref:Uncharacterized protein n=1 Tax=Ephemerocybe angulata TaxID=980116 RepID=A0A8H6H6T5_9AGAR|nr:hypothetical protein DFP72DRAFT_1055142 [Tulosesus angulatus]
MQGDAGAPGVLKYMLWCKVMLKLMQRRPHRQARRQVRIRAAPGCGEYARRCKSADIRIVTYLADFEKALREYMYKDVHSCNPYSSYFTFSPRHSLLGRPRTQSWGRIGRPVVGVSGCTSLLRRTSPNLSDAFAVATCTSHLGARLDIRRVPVRTSCIWFVPIGDVRTSHPLYRNGENPTALPLKDRGVYCRRICEDIAARLCLRRRFASPVPDSQDQLAQSSSLWIPIPRMIFTKFPVLGTSAGLRSLKLPATIQHTHHTSSESSSSLVVLDQGRDRLGYVRVASDNGDQTKVVEGSEGMPGANDITKNVQIQSYTERVTSSHGYHVHWQ